ADDIVRVRLVSSAQHRHAPATASAGSEVETPPDGQLSSKPPQTMRSIPARTRRSKFSWNTNHARIAVNTPSRFSSRDTVDADAEERASISSTGPTKPPEITAPAD